MLTKQELTEDIQNEIGEASIASIELTTHLAEAESCETLEDLQANLMQARYVAQAILSQINDQLARI